MLASSNCSKQWIPLSKFIDVATDQWIVGARACGKNLVTTRIFERPDFSMGYDTYLGILVFKSSRTLFIDGVVSTCTHKTKNIHFTPNLSYKKL